MNMPRPPKNPNEWPPLLAGVTQQNNDEVSKFGMRNFHLAGRSTVHAQNAIVATSHPQAALAGIEVLRAGGTAVDAAGAACAPLRVVEPPTTGLRGGLFSLL